MNKSGGKVLTERPVVIIRKKAETKSSPPGPAQPSPRVSAPVTQTAAPAIAPPSPSH